MRCTCKFSLKSILILGKKYSINLSIISSKLLFTLIFLLLSNHSKAQVVTTSYTSSTTFTVPVGVTALKVECWGAGGKGSSIADAIDVGAGGGGGAYSSSLICVIPGTVYNIAVGAGGTGATPNGGDTYFGNTSLVMAKGGAGLANNVTIGGAGGKAAQSIGQTKYDGGDGSSRTSYTIVVSLAYRSGAGGGGAGSTGAGNLAVGVVAGAAKTENGGKGGDGVDGGLLSLLGGFVGNAGSDYGAGGGGAGRGALFSTSVYNGGNGGKGLVRISYEQYSCDATLETTWNGTAWSNGTPQGCKKAIINGNYNTTTNGSFTACSLQILAGRTLTVGNGTNTDSVIIYNQLDNAGNLVINNNASLLQHYSVKNNAGTISMHRYTKPMYRYDYTYWSSPLTFDSGYTLQALSPLTLADKYFSWNTTTQSWNVVANGTEIMTPAKGYIVRAPQNYSTVPSTTQIYHGAVFTGKPNNGNVTLNVVGTTDPLLKKWNLIGNPYPSAIDIEKFLFQNNTLLDGTAYVWTHNTPPNSSGTYTAADFAVYNFSGSVGTSTLFVPTKNFASGQSFFVKGIANGTVTFNNGMRVASSNNQFYRQQQTTSQNVVGSEKHRVWLNLTNEQSAFSQALVGYIANATNDLDWGYDGELFAGNSIALYSVAGDKELSINGRSLPFNEQDFIPLGYKSNANGNLKISIAAADGQLANTTIYLQDKVLNIIHNLKESDYEFTTTSGIFKDRFVLRYTEESLGIKTYADKESIIVYKDSNRNIMINSGLENMNQISIFDISGRLIYERKDVGATNATIESLPVSSQVLLVNIITDNGQKFVKKILY